MKPLYLLTLILSFGNCITTTSYYMNGNKVDEKEITKEFSITRKQPIVNLSVNDKRTNEINGNPFVAIGMHNYKLHTRLRGAFKNDSSSPVYLKINLSNNPASFWAYFVGLLLPCVWSNSALYSMQYGSENQSINKDLEIVKNTYLPIPFVSFLGATMTADIVETRVKHDEIEERFLLSLREEIAKIAPLAEPDSDTPQTADLPTTFNDIVVLKNGDILEGVHTKVTPTTLEVTESNGKKTIYKKSQVLSVKKK